MTDPRRHRHAVEVDDKRIRYACGCVNEIAAPSGVLRCVSKCGRHKGKARDPAGLDAAYYEKFGVIDADGLPVATRHVAELTEALGGFLPGMPGSWALEIGCGASPYVEAIRSAGYSYLGIDASPWAASWMRLTYEVPVADGPFDEFDMPGSAHLILAAHVVEHMEDAPGAIQEFAGMLVGGGELWIVVPDDEDPLNPDHLWFFTPETLKGCVEAAGLDIERLEVRRHVAHEQFIYLRARKT